MRQSTADRLSQRGAALIVALLVLLMVSVLGLSAMRSSVSSSKVATGVQADIMTFDAAETALHLAINTLGSMSEQELTASVVDGNRVEYCVTAQGTIASGPCSDRNRMDSRNLLQASAFAVHEPDNCRPVSGFNVEEYKDVVISLLGESNMQVYNIENHHLQEGLKLGRFCM